MADAVDPNDPRQFSTYPHWRDDAATYPFPQPPEHPDHPHETASDEDIAEFDAKHAAYVDAVTSPINREWIVRTIGMMTRLMRVGSGVPENYADEAAYRKERLAIACLGLANVAMCDAPPVVMTAFATSLAKRMDALNLFNPTSGDAAGLADEFLEDDAA